MLKDKRFTFLIVFFIAQRSIACEKPNDLVQSGKCATYTYNILPGLRVPIDLLVPDDAETPGSEPNVDYTIYNTQEGNHWPDWDWAGEKKKKK